MPPTAPSIRTLVFAEPDLGHWSAVAWTSRYGPVLMTSWRSWTDADNPPTVSDLPATDSPYDPWFMAREVGLVYARNGQEAWRQYGDAYRAARPRRRAA